MNIQRQEGKGETGGKTQKEWKEKERVPVELSQRLNSTQTHRHTPTDKVSAVMYYYCLGRIVTFNTALYTYLKAWTNKSITIYMDRGK